MPKIKSNITRSRKFRTPDSALNVKYEKIALLSAVYSQSQIISKLGGSYGTIYSALEFFATKRLSEVEWAMTVNNEFIAIIGLSGFYNKQPRFEIENIDEFNQYLADKISANINQVFQFELEYYGYKFTDLSIVSIADLTAIFNALIGTKGFNYQIRSRYTDHIELTANYNQIVCRPKEESVIADDFKNSKSKAIATKDHLILL